MSELRVIPLGVGDAFSAHYYSSCLAVGYAGKWLLIDCPHPIRKMLREASLVSGVELDVGDLCGVAITHLHADHASGLEGLLYFSHFVLRRKMQILAHEDVLRRLWSSHLAAGMDHMMDSTHQVEEKSPQTYYRCQQLEERTQNSFEGFSIECRKTIHHVPTTAFKIRVGGRCLGYSADTAFDPTLIEWLSDADLIIHETNYGVHTPYDKLCSLPEELRTKMRLIHYPDPFDVANSEIEALRQGVIYKV